MYMRPITLFHEMFCNRSILIPIKSPSESISETWTWNQTRPSSYALANKRIRSWCNGAALLGTASHLYGRTTTEARADDDRRTLMHSNPQWRNRVAKICIIRFCGGRQYGTPTTARTSRGRPYKTSSTASETRIDVDWRMRYESGSEKKLIICIRRWPRGFEISKRKLARGRKEPDEKNRTYRKLESIDVNSRNIGIKLSMNARCI